jgi:hypothetical protein
MRQTNSTANVAKDQLTHAGLADYFEQILSATPAGTAFIVEWYQVRGDKIAALRAVFDARPFAAMFGQ